MGGKTTVQAAPAPPPPQAPTFGGSIQEFIAALPQMLQAQQEYAPQFAGLEQEINQQLFPQTAGLQESLAAQAAAGIQEPLTEDIRNEFLNTQRALTGRQSTSPIGSAGIAGNLVQFREQLRQQNQNLALSLAGRQPLASPGGGQALQGVNTGQALGFNQGVFGTQAGIFGSQANLGIAGLNADVARRGQNFDLFGNIIGSGAGTLGSAKLLGY